MSTFRGNVEEALEIVANGIRLRILERLAVDGPQFPLRLAKELGESQQGVLRHLHLMEEAGLLRRSTGPSDAGGAPRTYYEIASRLAVSVEVARGTFRARTGGPGVRGRSGPRKARKR